MPYYEPYFFGIESVSTHTSFSEYNNFIREVGEQLITAAAFPKAHEFQLHQIKKALFGYKSDRK